MPDEATEPTEVTEATGAEATGTETVDWSFVPETFIKDDVPDTGAFRARYDELAAQAAQAEEAQAALPESPDKYEIRLGELEYPEGVTLPEGYELSILKDDPDLPALKQVFHDHKLPQEAVDRIMEVAAIREARQVSTLEADRTEQIGKLGPDGQSRIDTVKKTLDARLPPELAADLYSGITTAAALRGMEKLLEGGRKVVPSTPSRNTSDMKPMERLEYGLRQRAKG